MADYQVDRLFGVACTIVLALASCTVNNAKDAHGQTTRLSEIATATSMPTTSLPTPTTTVIQLQTVASEVGSPPPEADVVGDFIQLLVESEDCILPCLLGVQPGVTTWEDAENIIDPYALEVSSAIQLSPLQHAYDVLIPVPPSVYPTRLLYRFVIEDGVVQRIEGATGNVESFQLSSFLQTIGRPGEIWVKTYARVRDGSLPFIFVLYNPDKGIIAQFSSEATVEGDWVVGCPQSHYPSVSLALMSPAPLLTFEEAIANTIQIGPQQLWQYQRLEDVTDLDSQSFFDLYSVANDSTCIKTEAANWPDP